MQQAVELHRQGKLERAEQLYREIVLSEPRHFDALHMLGVIAAQRRQFEQADRLIGQALAIQPGQAEALRNHGNVLAELNRPDSALACYDRALAAGPDHPATLFSRANTLRSLRRLDEAVACYDRLLALKPDHPDALNNRGIALRGLHRLDEAVASYRRALELRPKFTAALSNRGVALIELNRFDAALADFDQVLVIQPDCPEVLFSRGNALKAMQRMDEALADYDQALRLKPDYCEALVNRGNALQESGHLDLALASFDRALAVDPDNIQALNNRGITLVDLNRAPEALAAHDRALAIKPDDADTHFNRAVALEALRRWPEALASYGCSLAIRPEDADTRMNETLCRLLTGDLATGWRQYGCRWQSENYRNAVRPFAIRPLTTDTRRALLWGEQGVGDQILYASMLPDVVRRGITGVVEVEPRLVPLFARSFPSFECVARADPPHARTRDHFDASLPMADLGRWLRGDFDSFPHRAAYLQADRDRVGVLRQRYGAESDTRTIGISWRSVAPRTGDAKTSRLLDWAPILKLPGIRFVSLQYGEQDRELAEVSRSFGVDIVNDPEIEQLRDLDDFAAQVSAMDHVVTISNTTAHFAGALGVPASILLPYARGTPWYWFADRSDSPWYASVALVRQSRPADWSDAIQAAAARVAQALPSQ